MVPMALALRADLSTKKAVDFTPLNGPYAERTGDATDRDPARAITLPSAIAAADRDAGSIAPA